MPLSALVQLAVLSNLSQEGVLGIKWAARKDKGARGFPPAGSWSSLYPGMFPLAPEQTAKIWLLFQSTLHHSTSQIMILLLPTLAEKTDPSPSQHSPAVNSFCPIRDT